MDALPTQGVAAIDVNPPANPQRPVSPPDPGSAATSASAPAPTVQFIRSDRFCRGCDVNLIGTQITREPHYGLMVATCPGCGVVNPVVVYPHVGRWTARWTGFFAGITLLLLILVLLGATTMLVVMDYAIADEVSRPLRYEVQNDFDRWLTSRYPDDPNRRYWNHQPADMAAWIESGGLAGVDLGAMVNALGPEELLIMFFGLLAAFSQGVVLAVLLLRASWRRRLAITASAWLLVMMVVLAVTIPMWWMNRPDTIYDWFTSRLVWPIWVGAQFLTLATVLGGVLVGRQLMRLLVSAMLGPRSRAALAVLWTTDGLTPPRR